MSGFSEKEKAFFRRQKGGGSKLKAIGFAIVLLFIAGVSLDALNGFPVLRAAKTPALTALGLLILGVFYVAGESVSEWINSKDKVSNPLHIRAFHLLLLLCLVGAVAYGCYFLLELLGWEI